ncbi:four-helix bundle copper-binding protein [Diaphorobacter caeni]|nr:four-helix bundle copper-binding protein [Diaphorobacter caeni]
MQMNTHPGSAGTDTGTHVYQACIDACNACVQHVHERMPQEK